MPDERLDARLSREAGVTRSKAAKLIREGLATVDGREERRPGARIDEACAAVLRVPEPVPIDARAEAIPLSILYQDAHIAVVDKPAGMVVHPAAGNFTGTLVNALLHHLDDLSGIGGALRPGIVHRLDKDTSGLLLIAKDDVSHARLSEALAERKIEKIYRAVILGHLKEKCGVIEAPIARHPTDRKRMAVVRTGRYARTEFSVDSESPRASLLTVRLITGRTHQIRVHFASLGHPVLGDVIYGARWADAAPRLMLHAFQIGLEHPVTGEPLRFEAPMPDAFQKYMLNGDV